MRKILIKCEDCQRKIGELEQIDSAKIFIDFAICDSCDRERINKLGDCEE